MKSKQIITVIFTIIFQTLLSMQYVYSCSLIKITANGKTIIGNNEDFSNPDTRIWFQPGNGIYYGVVYVGYDNLFPEGGMNEAGLVFDAFAVPDKPVTDTLDKKIIFEYELKKKIMTECATVEEVKALINKCNISFWSHAVFIFADKTGKYLIVDGDSKNICNNDYFVQTNFRQSEIKDENEIDCWRYKKAISMLRQNKETDINYCTSIMDSIHQGGTLYTTIYDTWDCIFYLYCFHNFNKPMIFNLKEELKKGERILSIPELFPDVQVANYVKYCEFKSSINSILFSDLAKDSAKVNQIKSEFKNFQHTWYILLSSGYEALHKKDISKAFAIFNLYIELFPESADGYDAIGEAYMEKKQYNLALMNYKHSVELKPESINGKQRINVLMKLLEKE